MFGTVAIRLLELFPSIEIFSAIRTRTKRPSAPQRSEIRRVHFEYKVMTCTRLPSVSCAYLSAQYGEYNALNKSGANCKLYFAISELKLCAVRYTT